MTTNRVTLDGMKYLEAAVLTGIGADAQFTWITDRNSAEGETPAMVLRAVSGSATATGRFSGQQLEDAATQTFRTDTEGTVLMLVASLLSPSSRPPSPR